MRRQSVRDQNEHAILKQPPIINTKFNSTPNLAHSQYPLYLACKFPTAKAQSTDVLTSKHIAAEDGLLSHKQYEPGDNITMDKFIVKTLGRLHKDYGCETHKIAFMAAQSFKFLLPISFESNLRYLWVQAIQLLGRHPFKNGFGT